mgnify:CR=1 FL=1
MPDFIGTIPACLNIPSGDVQPALLPEKQVATYLNVSVQTLRKWRSNGVGPVWNRMGTCIRYPVAGLHEYIAETQCDFTGQDTTRSASSKRSASS